MNRFLEKNPVCYVEPIFYDLIKFDKQFLSQQQFINNIIISKIKDNILSFNIVIKNLQFNFSADKINVNIQLNKQIDVDININYNIQINHNELNVKTQYVHPILNNIIVTLDTLTNTSNSFYKGALDIFSITNINIGDWIIDFSPMIYQAILCKSVMENNYYFIYNPLIKNKITIIHYIDYFTIIKEYINELNFTDTDELNKKYDMFIFDNYGNLTMYFNNHADLHNIIIPPYIKILLFNLTISYVDAFYYLTLLKPFINYKNYSFLRANLGIILNYRLYYLDKSASENFPEEIDLTTLLEDYNNYETWRTIFNLPYLNSEQLTFFEENIIKKYENLYVSTTKIIDSDFTHFESDIYQKDPNSDQD